MSRVLLQTLFVIYFFRFQGDVGFILIGKAKMSFSVNIGNAKQASEARLKNTHNTCPPLHETQLKLHKS